MMVGRRVVHLLAFMALAALLFLITLAMNLLSGRITRRFREVYE